MSLFIGAYNLQMQLPGAACEGRLVEVTRTVSSSTWHSNSSFYSILTRIYIPFHPMILLHSKVHSLFHSGPCPYSIPVHILFHSNSCLHSILTHVHIPFQSLQNLGLTHVLHMYLKGMGLTNPQQMKEVSEYQYEAAWRCSIWEPPETT